MQPANQTLLDVRDLSIEFLHRKGNLQAIHHLSLSMQPGEVLGMVGESGAGKSLTGAAISGLLQEPGRVKNGEIWFQGQRIDNLDDDARRQLRGKAISCIFQDPLTSLNPVLTIGQQLTETIRTHLPLSAAQASERAINLLTEVGMSSPAHASISASAFRRHAATCGDCAGAVRGSAVGDRR
nr:ATP-binding cassette domain-containing protein [Pantoea sp. CTOTU49201]